MSQNGEGKYKSRTLIDASEDSPVASSENVKVFSKELVQVDGDGSCFLAAEDEVIGVEHLLAEPNCNDLEVDGLLNFDTFNPQKCFNIDEFSAAGYGHFRNESGALDSSLSKGEKTKDEVLDGMLEGTDDKILAGKNNLSDACEDYLLDTEFDDYISNLNCIPSKGSCMRNSDLEHHSAILGGRECGAEVTELSNASIPALEVTSDQNTLLLNKMASDELHEAFGDMVGHETAVTDKQWLKHRISFGLQNLEELDNSLRLSESQETSNEDKREIGFSTSDESSLRASSAFTDVFNFKTKPRVRHVKKKRDTGSESVMNFASELNELVFGFPESGEKESMVVTRKRVRKPTQRYIEDHLEQKSRYKRKKSGISDTCSKDKILPTKCAGQNYKRGSGSTSVVCRKETYRGACIQVPFGLPVQEGCSKKKIGQVLTPKKEHESAKCKDIILQPSNVEFDTKPYSAESPDSTYEDDCITWTKTKQVKQRRKHHLVWSLPEVLKLVEGVSKYGVGRWTEIKRLLFSSSAHRTSVDLKDKWRNLLRASCTRLQSRRG
ncbi:unnamed protein product, partial [Ilex paraguariensis]